VQLHTTVIVDRIGHSSSSSWQVL